MAKNKKRQKSRYKLWTAGSIILLAILGLVIYSAVSNQSAPNSRATTSDTKSSGGINLSPASPSDNNANNKRKLESNTNNSGTLSSNGSGSATGKSAGSQTSSSSSFSVDITRVTVDNGTQHVQVGNVITGATSGGCTVIASKNGEPNITSTSQISLNVNTYTCGVFNMPFSQFPATGKWSITLTVNSNGTIKSTTWPQPVDVP